jgi:OFA family oxalate/formate antiporter-like MFS transporter
MFVLGLIYAWSIFQAFLHLNAAQSSYIFAVIMVCFSVGSFGAALLSRVASSRLAIYISAVLVAAGFALPVWLTPGDAPSYYTMLGCYGVAIGLSAGIGYNAIVSSVVPHFPSRVGFATGIMLLGFGISGLILGGAAHVAMEALGWKKVFLGLAAIGFVALMSAGALVGEQPKATKVVKAKTNAKPFHFLAPDVVLFYVWRALLMGAGITLIGSSASGAHTLGFGKGTAALLVGLIAVCNAVARLIGGAICDKKGVRTLMLLATCAAIIAYACLALAFATECEPLYYGAALFAGLIYGSLVVTASSYSRERFGAEHYSGGLALLNSASAVGSFVSMLVVHFADANVGVDASTDARDVYSTWLIFAVVSLGLFLLFAWRCLHHPTLQHA